MLLARLFRTADAAIGALPGILAHLAAGLVVAALTFVYTYLAVIPRRHIRNQNPENR